MTRYQPELPFEADQAWPEMLRRIRADVEQIGRKEVAYALDVSPTALSHALNERERHNVQARWLPYLVRMSRSDDLAAFLPQLRGLEVVRRAQLTPEERVMRLEAAAREVLGPSVCALLFERAFGK